jgi:entericidin A
MTRSLTLTFCLLALLVTSGCNTVKGLGRDIESVGQAGERAL